MQAKQIGAACNGHVQSSTQQGNEILCRALLDRGAQSCFVTSSCAKKLALKQSAVCMPIRGLGRMSTQTNKKIRIKLRSRINNFKVDLDSLIIDQIIQFIPDNRIQIEDIQVPEGIILADPEFYKSAGVDLLLGIKVFFDIMCIGRIKLSTTKPTWQKTLLGWITAGNLVTSTHRQNGTICNLAMYDQLNANIARFWQIEHSEKQSTRSPKERLCEGHFVKTHRRNKHGRFIVSMPIKEERLQELGDSRESVIQKFKALERKFGRQPQLKQEYSNFIHEHLELGHMKEI